VACVYALATVLVILLIGVGSDVGRLFGIILAPICASLAAGIFYRFNPVRILLLILLGTAVLGDALLMVYFLAGAFEVISVPVNKDPMQELLRIPLRFSLTVVMFLYLRRADVRNAFRRNREPIPDAEMVE
jgi:hypothetical protein